VIRPRFALLLALALIALTASSARGGDSRAKEPARAGDAPAATAPTVSTDATSDARTLTAAEVDHYIAGYIPQIKTCYLDQVGKAKAATGALRLEMIIHRDGSVFKLSVLAPGVTGKRLRRLDACVRKQAADWHFPVRRGFTSTVVPFFFQKTTAAGAGPHPSCWSARGCPDQRDAAGGKP